MKNIFGEKRQRFGFRKLSIGLVSATVASLFFASSVAAAPSASAQSINYSYVTEQELTDAEKELIIRDLPGLAQETDANYYLIYRPATGTASTPSTSTSQVLPNTGSVETGLLVAGGVSLLLLAVRFGKKGKKELAGVILLTATGASFFGPTSSALTSQILARYNHAIEISAGQALPTPAEIDGYVYVGYLKDSKAIEQATSEGIRTETIVNKTEAIPFEIQTVENPQLSEGTERVLQEGQDGERTVTIKQVHSKGQIISEEEISSTVTKTAVPKIVEVGTKQATDDIVTEVPDTAPSHELPTLQITEEVSTYTESIPFETQEVADDTLLEGTRQIVQEGKAGQKTIETKKTYIDGILVKTETVSETINQTAAPQIIHVGTRPVTSVPDSAPSHEVPTISLTEETLTHTEAIAFDVQEIYDANLAEGSREVEQKGQAGVRTIETKNYYADGVLIKSEQVSDVVTKAPVTEVVRVGTKTADVLGVETVVATEELPFETTVTETEELYVGEEKVVNEGKVGSKEVTTTYQTLNGVRQPNPTVTEKVLEEPTTKEVLKGTKPIEGTETETDQVEITFETEYVDDPTLLEGKTKVVTAGVNGSKTVTTTYQTIKGVRQENPTVTEEITKQPVKQVIARGTKVEKVPQVIITDLVENDDAKSATISYKLTDETSNFLRAVALLYDNTGALVKEQAIDDPNGEITLENLDFYTDYTVKTKIFYTLDEQEQSSEQEAIIESMRKFDLVYKKIEIKDIDAVTVYRRKNGSYIGQEFLEELPTSTDELFIKVTSDRFKEVYLPVSSVEETTLNGKAVFKLVSSFDELVQDKDAQYVANREFYIPKMATDANTYTSFKALIDAMKANPSGTFKLGAHLDASEVPVGDIPSYVTGFSGTLDGVNDGYAFSISNLKAPLFFNLNGKVQNLDIKNASLNTTSKNPLAAIAINANGATITNVAVEASIKGPQNVSGLVHSATNSTIKDVSFKGSIEVTGTDASLTGGILGNGTMASVGNAKVDATITLPGTENQVAGGIVGRTMLVYDVPGSVYNAYATGSIVTTGTGAIIGGIAGANQVTGAYAPYSGNVNNVISDMTGATSIIGQPANPTGKIKDGFTTTSDSLSNVTVITDEEAQAKAEAMAIQATIDDSVPLNLNQYSVDYLTLDKAQADHETAYYNMEKILPFYNKELLVYYGNKVATDDKLNKVRLLDVVPMKDKDVVADVYAEKATINKIMLHYADGTVDYKTVSYLEDFKNNHVVEYTISGTDLIYTPESFLNDRSALVNDLVSSLSSVVLDSDAMKAIINYPTKLNADTQTGTAKDFYFGESFEQVKANLESNVRKILVASLNGQGKASEDYIKEKITNNKEAFVLGLTYLNRWYDINFGEMNTKDLTIFEPDFFGNDAASALDMILAIGNGGYDVLRAHNNVTTFASIIGKQNKQAKLFDMLEDYRALFLPEMTNNEWFKQTTKAYVVEGKSLIPEVAAKQETTDTYSKYNVGAYSKIVNDTVSNPTWKYNHMLLPLLTLPQENIFIITNMNTIAIGSYEHYVDNYSTVENRDKVRQMVDLAAERQRDNADFWYKMMDETNRDKLFRSVLNNEGYMMFGPDGKKAYRNLTAEVDAIQDFYGPINKWYREHPSIKTAYADGSETYYITYDMLSDYGTALYTHEMVHNQDGDIYLKGYGRRNGQGMEVYAQGLLQNVFNVTEMNLGFNAVFTSDDANRVHVGDPVARFNSEAEFNEYYHNQFDVLYLLDYLEGMAILGKSDDLKKDWLRKIDNYYVQTNGVNTHAGNNARELTDAEVASLKTFEDLIDNSIIDYRQYFGPSDGAKTLTKEWSRNGYHSVPMFAANYSALSNPYGSPGDIMFRRMAFELIAAKGYTEGFIPYASGQLSDYAMSQGSTIYDTWNKKDTGLITDTHVLNQVFKGQFTTWEEFKKAMFAERVEKAEAGKLKPFTMQYELGVANSTKEVTVTTYAQLQALMEEAMEADTNGRIFYSTNNVNLSRVHALKVKVYQALMNSTNDFRTSIFNP
ncbi:YSIRK-type signal peptide-containing protein [Streptococcus suis]|uniref:YSIRK-type signal peptide-containing protein n=1 Tax=Streptococcus suis TaxID=1307 RepID=A0A3R8XMY7_STRSU|nr:ZmpA/ZmpB/ZmpC family metallo-endopeptidase [Streptococcus suis]RRR50313.1 YSIRK-type signal peptide-containing protein [Streptococcus suis]